MCISSVSPNPNSRNDSPAQSFLEMLSSGPSRSPSPARPPTVNHEDVNNPSLTNWSFQHLEENVNIWLQIYSCATIDKTNYITKNILNITLSIY